MMSKIGVLGTALAHVAYRQDGSQDANQQSDAPPMMIGGAMSEMFVPLQGLLRVLNQFTHVLCSSMI
jgi:hypothetical protein